MDARSDSPKQSILHYLGSNSGMTGVETFVQELALFQARHGHQVGVMFDPERRQELADVCAAHGVAVHHSPTARSAQLPGSLRKLGTAAVRGRLLARVAALLPRYDVLHVHSVGVTGLEAHLAAALLRFPGVIVTHHASLSWFEPQRTRLSDLTFRLECARAARVVLPYRALAQEYAERGVPAARSLVVPFCVDTRRYRPDPQPTAAETLRLVMSARMVPDKGHEELLRAIAALVPRHPGLRLKLVGDGPSAPRVAAQIDELQLNAHVELTGRVHQLQMPEHYASADVAVLPSYMPGETFPLCLLEAMACGLPVIGARWFGIPDIVEHEVTGLVVEPRDVAGLSAAIERMLCEPQFRAQCGERALARVHERFSTAAVARTYDRVYAAVGQREPGMQLHVTTLDTIEALERLAPEWDALEARLTPRLPFSSSRWNCLWWRHFAEQRASVRDQLCSFAVRDATGKLIAIAPMMITHRPGVGPVRVRKLQYLGTDGNVTELRRLICAPEHVDAAQRALLEHADARSDWDWCEWSGLVAAVSGEHQLSHDPRFSQCDERVDYMLKLEGTWESFRSSRSRNIKESLRKCYNSLKRDGLVPSLRVVDHPDEVSAALDVFFALHARRAAQTDTIEHRDVFSSERARSFLAAYIRAAAERGETKIFQLYVGDRIAATRLAFRLGDELYLYFSGYDPDLGKYSVMTTLVAEALQWGFREHIRLVNLSPGTDVSKTRWSPEEVRLVGGTMRASRMRGRFAEAAYNELVQRVQRDGWLRKAAGLVKRTT